MTGVGFSPVNLEDSPDLRRGWFDEWPGMVRPHVPWTEKPVHLKRESSLPELLAQ
jgi:hypothetical protein